MNILQHQVKSSHLFIQTCVGISKRKKKRSVYSIHFIQRTIMDKEGQGFHTRKCGIFWTNMQTYISIDVYIYR